jgi:hypothetical protein
MTVWQAATVGAWALLALNLALTLRVVRRLRSEAEQLDLEKELERTPELSIGATAPPFRARTLHGGSARLEDYAGRRVAFVVVSPECPTCRREIAGLIRLAALARERAEVELVLVSDHGSESTAAWLDAVAREHRLKIELPVLCAPPSASTFITHYDPRIIRPYFCLLDADGTVAARGPVGAGEWLRLRGVWEGATVQARRQRMAQ